jgi:hypothetical protein
MNILLIIGIVLLVLWLFGFIGFIPLPGLGWLINIALVIAVIFIIIWLLKKVFKLF